MFLSYTYQGLGLALELFFFYICEYEIHHFFADDYIHRKIYYTLLSFYDNVAMWMKDHK